MRFDHLKSLYFSGIVFVICLAGGLLLSRQKLLWGDELFTQEAVIDTNSYANILSSRFPEGNKNPLFYIIQKSVCDIFFFHLPPVFYLQERNRTRDITSQVIMRVPSNIYMSLALALIFYFFTRFFSIFAALYALGVALVCPMVWEYWVEARPYSLWFLLTTVQLLLLSYAIKNPGVKKAKTLFTTHVLLALTMPTSIIQISVATLMLGLKAKYNKKQLALIWVLPAGIAFFYYLIRLPFRIRTYMFGTNFFDVIMPEHLYVYVIYALAAWVVPEKYKRISCNIFFLPVFLLFLASVFLILYADLFNINSDHGFFSRYLIYMVPADILMFSLASFDLRQWSRQNFWVCMNVSIFLGGLVIMRGLMTYRDILAAATYLHSPNF